MKKHHYYAPLLLLVSTMQAACSLFQPACKCEQQLAAIQAMCPEAAAQLQQHSDNFPSSTTDEKGNPTDLEALAATRGGDVESSAALEPNDLLVAEAEESQATNDDTEHDDEDDSISDELSDNDTLPDDIAPSQMDQILPSGSQRIDIPDTARNSVQIPVLTSLRPSDEAWKTDVIPSARELADRTNNTDSKEIRAMTARFLPHYAGKSTAAITPGSTIEIFTPGRRTLKRNIAVDYQSPLIPTLWPFPVYAAQLVDDEPLEIVTIGANNDDEPDTIIMTVYKVFGDQIGEIFRTEVGLVSDNKIIKTAQIEFVSGKKDIGIRRVPIDSKGNPDKSNAIIYDWNHWEGAYRHNTAPERERLGPPNWSDDNVQQDNIAP